MNRTEEVVGRLKLRDLRMMLTVAETGNMSKAAARLAVSRPVVSRTIADLEQTLGARLFDRGARGLDPTAFGRALITRSIAAFDELTQSVREIRFLSDPNASGELRIGASEYMAAGLLAVAVDRLARRYPQLRFEVELVEPLSRLRERKVEFVVARLLSADAEPETDIEILFYERVFIAAGHGNKWARRRRPALAELIDEPWILAPPEIAEGSPLLEATRSLGLAMPRAAVLGLSLPLRNGLLATGRFLTVVPGSVMRYGAERSLLRLLPIELPPWGLPVAIVTLKNRSLTPTARLLLDCVRELAQPLRDASGIRSSRRSPGSGG